MAKPNDVRVRRPRKAKAGDAPAPKIEKRKNAKPSYDADTRTLWFRGRVVKHFSVPAKNQSLILEAFEEQRWSARIDIPLPPRPGMASKDRLHNAINRLNHKQQHPLLEFHGDGTGTRVSWSVRKK